MRSCVILTLAISLGACATSGTEPIAAPPPTTPASTPASDFFRAPEVMRESGTDAVIGARAQALTRRFGAPRIDLIEGDARKLQFAGQSCVLDIYLYPLQAGGDPIATHVEARLRAGGKDTDRAQCIAELQR